MKHLITTISISMVLALAPQNTHAQLVVSADYGYPQLMGIEVEYRTALRMAPYIEMGMVNQAFGLRTYGRRGINFKTAVGIQFGQTAMVDVGGGSYLSTYIGLYQRFNRVQIGLEGGGLYGPRWGDGLMGQGDVYFPHVQLKVGVVIGQTRARMRARPNALRRLRSRQ